MAQSRFTFEEEDQEIKPFKFEEEQEIKPFEFEEDQEIKPFVFEEDQEALSFEYFPGAIEEGIPTDPRDVAFGSVLSRTVDELQASGWAGVRVLGEMFNSERMIDAGNRGVEMNERQIAKHGRPLIAEEVEDWEDAWTFVRQGVAQVMPSIAVSMPTAILGAKGGAAIGTAAFPGVGSLVGGLIGGALGAFMPSFILSTGEVDRAMKERAGAEFEAPGAAMSGGAMVASLDVASIAFGLKPLMPVLMKKTSLKKVTEELVKAGVERGVATAALGHALKASVMEGATESTQEGVEDFMAETATGIASEEGQLQSALFNAFLLGAIGGFGMGGVSGAISQYGINSRKKSEREVTAQLKVIEEEVLKQVNILGQSWQDILDKKGRDGLVAEAERRGIKIRKNASIKSILKTLTEYEVFRRKAVMQNNYYLENFGALTAQERKDRIERQQELSEKTIPELLEIAQSYVIEEEGAPDIPLVPVNRNDPVDVVINRILDQEFIQKRALTGGASILFGAALTPNYQARLRLLEKEKISDLRKQIKARGITTESAKLLMGKKDYSLKGATKKELASLIMKHDTLTFLQLERKQNYLLGTGYKWRYRNKIRKEGKSEDINFYTVDETSWENNKPEDSTETWEEFVEKSLSLEGGAVSVTYTEDGENVNFLDETENIETDKGVQFETRDIRTDEEGIVVGGTGLFNNYEKSRGKKRIDTKVTEIRFEQGPDIVRQADFFGGLMSGLRHWFQPSGPLGWEAFMLSRKRIGRIRAMNKMANQMATKVEMAIGNAIAEGEYLNYEDASRALTSALRRSIKRFKRTGEETGELKKERSQLRKDIKEAQREIKIIEAFRAGGIAFEELTQKQQDILSTWNSKEKLRQKKAEVLIWKGDLQELNQMIDPSKYSLTPTQAAYLLKPSLRDSFIELRGFIDMLSGRILREVPRELLANKKAGKMLEEVIRENIGSYMTRSYKIFEPGGYDPLSWWNRTMPTKSARKMQENVLKVRKLLQDRYPRWSDSRINQEVKLLGQGYIGEGALAELGGILSQTKPAKEGSQEANIIDVAQKLLKRRKRIPKEIRALMGEVTDPGEAAAVTTARLATLLENNRFWQQLAVLNELPGQRLFSPIPVPKGETEGRTPTWFAKGKGLVVKVHSAGNNPFEGMYTTKEVAEVLGVQGLTEDIFNSSIWRNFVVAPKAYIQLGKIVLSPPAQIRNFLSAALFVAGNGHFIGFRNLPEAMKVVGHELFEGGVDSQGRPTTSRQKAQETYRELLDLGVMNTVVSLKDILSVFRMSRTGMFEGPGDFVAITANPFKNMYRRAEQLYTAADDFWKVVAYASELDSIKKAFATEAEYNQLLAHAKQLGMTHTLDQQNFSQARKELAAFKVRQTVPNYDYVGKFAELLRTGPFAFLGNFIAFPTEIVRTSANILSIAAHEIASDNSGMRRRGWARLIGYGTAAFGIGTAAQAIGQALNDIDDEDIEAARLFLPDWAKNNLLIPVRKRSEAEGGGFDFIDGSYIMVYDDLSRMVPTVMQEFKEGKETGRSVEDSVTIALSKTIGNFMEPFMEPSIYTQAVLDIAQNRNSNTGRPIWNEARARGLPLKGVGQRNVDLLNYFWEQTAPGFVAATEKVARGTQEGEKAYDRFGNKQELIDAWSSFMGIKITRVNPTSSLSFALTDLLNEQDDAEKIFMRSVYKRGPVPPEELIDSYFTMQTSNYFINQAIWNTFNAAERLNAKESIINIAKKERLGGAKQKRAMDNGENLPLKPLKSLRSLQKDFDAQTEIIEEAEGLPSIRFWPEDSFIEIYDFFLDLPLESDYQSELVREEEADLYE